MQKTGENKDLNKLLTAIEKSGFDIKEDPFASYLFGVILKDLNEKEEARKYFINSLNKFPYLWSAWVDLCLILEQSDYVNFFFLIFFLRFFFLIFFLKFFS
jgi:hypothetical protein